MKHLLKSENFIPIGIIFLVCFIALFDLLNPGIPLTHDGKDHVARIANFYQSLSEGIIIPRWAGNLNWGYGHPVMMFLYPLPSYFASVFHFFGFDFSNSLKLVFASCFVLSGLTMYVWLKSVAGRFPALLGAVLYIYAPYRFVDLYVRGAIGEHVAFIFPPLVCLFILKTSKHTSIQNLTGLAISFALLILAHNAISIMFLPILIGYALLLFYEKKKIKNFLFQLLFMGYGLLLSAFFWIPAFLEGKYTLRDIVTGSSEYADRFTSLKALIYGNWDFGNSGQFTTQIGIVGIMGVLFGVYVLAVKKKEVKTLLFWFLVLIVSVFLMLPISTFIYESVSTLQKFQFPWRFLSVTVFSVGAISAIAVSVFREKHQKIIIAVLITVLVVVSFPYMRAKDYMAKPDSFYSSVYEGTTDTGESSPIWSIRFMEERPKAPIEFIDGKGTVEILERSSTKRKYRVNTTENSRLVENTLYFPSWTVYIDSNEVLPEYQDQNYRGLITFHLEPGDHILEIVFENTKKRILGNFISLASIIGVVVLILISQKRRLYGFKNIKK